MNVIWSDVVAGGGTMIRQMFEGQMSMRQERTLGVVLLVAGLLIAGAAVTRMGADHAVHAQATPGDTRPTTPAPEPARPSQNNEGSTTGTAPSTSSDRPPATGTPLPPAPAEKTAPPIQRK
jgi:hypothetical protein